VILEKNAIDIYEILQEIYGTETMRTYFYDGQWIIQPSYNLSSLSKYGKRN
jgi:hypothetical protein